MILWNYKGSEWESRGQSNQDRKRGQIYFIPSKINNGDKNMKAMTCKQLGGACDKTFHANSFDEIAEMSKNHGMEMFQQGDEAHLKAMDEMQDLMKNPDAMKEWFENKRMEFDALLE